MRLNPIKVIKILILISLLIIVRKFENTLFYDPLLVFFKVNHKINNIEINKINIIKLMFNIGYRFILNSFLSILLINNIFKNIRYTNILSLSFIIILIIFFPIYYILLKNNLYNNIIFFYIRRIIIQPIILMISIPYFYYLNKSNQDIKKP